ncbi:MAG: FRG domain-containing protein [Veillonellales bacterium]
MLEIETEGKISSIISSISKLFPDTTELLFRGQSDYRFQLSPSIFRQGINYDNISHNEAEMYFEFIRRYPEYSTNHKSIFEWLTLMQHYGLPTRLLDWTNNLLVALYFGCEKDFDKDSAIYIFDPHTLYKENSFSTLILETQVISRSIDEFYKKIIFKLGDEIKSDLKINGYSLSKINTDPFILMKFVHPSQAANMPFTSFEVKQDIGPTLDMSTDKIIDYCYSDVLMHSET